MPDLIPLVERIAARKAAQDAIDAARDSAVAQAEKAIRTAEKSAARATAELAEAEAQALAAARLQCAKGFRRFSSCVAELLRRETLECARDCRAEYRSSQRSTVTHTGSEMPLMPLRAVGQCIITHAPETKARIARLDTIQAPHPHCAAKEIADAHRALMADAYDDRRVREVIIALERKLTMIGREAVPGGHCDLVWDGVCEGLDFYAIDSISRATCAADARAAAAALPQPPQGVAFRIANGWAKLRNVTMGDSPL
jgi:hypothetical protein